ncbi:hypothetical protein EJB05_49234 [Eragrostis curvula]|uniref:Uncharacterized protein n=1 Tax=Eragrostis curvula TaxID=38414 RepID=A0A5J9T438_9POAL|nr:hypothetical protein EJB05_49234 [Eragrostis curvula]
MDQGATRTIFASLQSPWILMFLARIWVYSASGLLLVSMALAAPLGFCARLNPQRHCKTFLTLCSRPSSMIGIAEHMNAQPIHVLRKCDDKKGRVTTDP